MPAPSQAPARARRYVIVRLVVLLGALFTLVHGGLVAGGLLWAGHVLAGRPAELRAAQLGIVVAGGLLFLSTLAALLVSLRIVRRRIIAPAEELWRIADCVGAGELAVEVPDFGTDYSMGRLGRAMAQMIAALRRLAGAIREAAHETGAMTGEITSGSAAMSAAAAEIAQTASGLSGQSAEMAQAIQQTAADAQTLREFAEQVAGGVRDGVERNAQLRRLASENRARLDESTRELETLAVEAQASAEAADALADASEQIRAFVTLVRKIARQSKLLALNASMEAARAGEHGEGFAVVASEIRKLASTSHQSAERTERLVHEVLERVHASREHSRRTVKTVGSVRRATEDAIGSFAQVEGVVAAMEAWASGVERAADESSRLVHQMTARLDELAHGTESFAAAMEEVAAASEEQSASTEEIAAAAATLASSSRRLAELVSTFRLEAASAEPSTGDEPPARERQAEARVSAPRLLAPA
ncbi:MAG TPA: methyl-accepting chemotaxis protein [Gemmatimonadaceae bacterium]|nr:methyl-accepting chemotaxis protein [Gemmatimonadaceae bacterium]